MRPQKILVISPFPSHPKNMGNSARFFCLLSKLKNWGHEIHLVYAHHHLVNIYPQHKSDFEAMRKEWNNLYVISPDFRLRVSSFIKEVDRQIGLIGLSLKKHFPAAYSLQKKIRAEISRQKQFKPTSIDLLYNTNIDKFLEMLTKKERFDLVIVEYLFYSKALNFFSKSVLKVLDTHDAYTNRHLPYIGKIIEYRDISTTQAEEAKALNRADIIIAIQNSEKDFFSKITDKKVVTIGHIVEPHKPIKRKSRSKNMLFVGTTTFENQDGIFTFIKYIFPKIRLKFPDAKLIIAGRISNVVEESEGIVKLGELEDLKETYTVADVVISPLFIGTGLKIKNVEALSYSKPLVTTPLGARGLEKGIGKAFIVSKSPEEFIDSIDRIFSDSEFYDYLSRNAYWFIKEYSEKSLNALKDIVNENG